MTGPISARFLSLSKRLRFLLHLSGRTDYCRIAGGGLTTMPVRLVNNENPYENGNSPSRLTAKGAKLRKIAPREFLRPDFVSFCVFCG
jgi:hypothetical protein